MQVVFTSFAGRFSDNPRALYDALAARGEARDAVWLVDQRHAHGFPPALRQVPYGSAEAIGALEQADLVVSNTHIELDWDKKAGATYLQTWHGTPLKHIHHDVLWAPEGRLEALDVDVARWDALLSPSLAATPWLQRAFGFRGEMLTVGYPRNDVLVKPGAQDRRERVRASLGIAPATPVVLYTPTWREDLRDPDGQVQFQLALDLAALTSRLPEYVLLLRLHYELSGRLGPVGLANVRDVSFHPEVSDLYLAADAMVTDYSSTMFDFAVTGKPMVFFTYDLAHYRDQLRGFYFDLVQQAPGPVLSSSVEVVDALSDLASLPTAHDATYAAFRSRFCHLEDGNAAGRVLQHFIR